MIIKESGDWYSISFPYRPHIIEAIKRLPERRYEPIGKQWLVPKAYMDHVNEFAKKYGFVFEGDEAVTKDLTIPELPYLMAPINLKRPLFPFQERGVAYGIEKKRLIIGDQMGLGKTSQAVAIVEALKSFPALVICPSTLKLNWLREFLTVSGRKSIILNNNVKTTFMRFYEAGMADVFIVNYESLKKYFVKSIDAPEGKPFTLRHVTFWETINEFKSVIIDESHRVKSFGAQQTKFTRGIAAGKEVVLALTGTPVINSPADLVAQLGIIDRINDLGGYKYFVKRYCSGTKGASNLKELNYNLNMNCYYGRKKSEVLKDLPPKMRQVILCEISEEQRKEYKLAEADLRQYLAQFRGKTKEEITKAMRGEVMVRMSNLKNISARGKISAVKEYIDDVIAEGEKIVLFGHLHEVIDKVKAHYKNPLTITGADSTEQRQKNIDAFQNDPKQKLIICGIQAAGVGITLTASSKVAFMELGWHSAIHDQCEDRCHRIGQLDSVQCIYFIGKDTIDQYVYSIIQGKREIAETVSGNADEVEMSIIDNYITLFENEHNN